MRGGTSCKAQVDPAKLDAIFSDLATGQTPGIAVGVAIGDEITWREAYGLASAELGVPLTVEHRLAIGSITKHFASLSYLLQCEAGRAALDDPIRRHWPELHHAVRDATVRQLMGHVSGLRDASELAMLFGGGARTVRAGEVVSLYAQIDPLAAPGEQWVYNNGGYILLAAIVERLANMNFAEVLQDQIFGPATMVSSRLHRFDDELVAGAAVLHRSLADGGWAPAARTIEGSGQGGVFATVGDLLAWLQQMRSPTVGREASWMQLLKPLRLRTGESTGYGLGLVCERYRGLEIISHPGAVVGGVSQMIRVPAADLNVVILANRDDISAVELGNRVLDVCLPGLDRVDQKNEAKPWKGAFRSPTTGRTVELWMEQSRQCARVDGEPAGCWSPDALTLRGLPPGSEATFSLSASSSGVGSELLYRHRGMSDLLVVLAQADGERAVPPAPFYEAPEFEAHASFASDVSSLNISSRFGSAKFDLWPMGQYVWGARQSAALPLSGSVTFDRETGGFQFRASRVGSIAFRPSGHPHRGVRGGRHARRT